MQTPLDWTTRADLFLQLAALERAGLDPQRAFTSISLGKKLQARITELIKQLKRGKTIAQAGLISGVFTPLESKLIAAACQAGSPANIYQRLGETASLNARLAKQVRARLVKPAAILVLSLLINPLPQLAAGTLSVGSYLWSVLWPLATIFVLLRLSHFLFKRAEQSPHHPLMNLLLAIPFFGDWYLRQQQQRFISSLGLLLEAGVPMFDAIGSALDSVGCSRFRTPQLLRSLQGGHSLSESMAKQSWLNRNEIISLIHTGEASGRLPEMLERIANQLSADLEHTATQFAAWLPRIIYTGLALWMAWGLLGSNAFSPHVPSDL
ncbi:type II secretion system F family protein [Chitinibacter sp. SCUT-21]|uniref:type II secretion system F family protein n=1 Tax=Chitinibacter sp. SCUT-21 TaxID=2970891 RepID=UPI0035A691A4